MYFQLFQLRCLRTVCVQWRGEGDIGNDIEHRFIVLGKQKAVIDNLLRAVSAVSKVIYIAMDFSIAALRAASCETFCREG